ncbi:MAG: hypothetical protein IOC82_16820 [Aestuariivirga sp.]|uniref:hypothetical protein n=1 Tax=Aestuariivirga sp. TaxID=2650926 RepID=UPI0025C69A3E|nr:hypothetical protein [Aestuariivirga sp.]MCA3562675.1 hypothetical protein [Aestuariivirga sp.]
MAKKPTGTLGPLTITTSDGRTSAEQQKIVWPSDQKDVERKILELFVSEFERTGAKFLRIEDGGTKDLDFRVTLPGGQAYVELMEVVIPEPSTIPFQNGQQWHEPLAYASNIFGAVEKKVRKYGFSHTIPIHLLLYLTHEQYAPNEAAIYTLRHYFKVNKHPFEYVFFLIPLTTDACDLRVIFTIEHRAVN